MCSTWLPSFCQKTAGCGFPFVSQGKLAVRPCATIWSRGLITNCGAAESKTKDMNVTPYPQTQKCTPTHTHTLWSLAVSGNVKHPQASTAKVTETELPCISPFPTAFGLLVYLFALTTNSKDSNSNHRKPFIQVSPQMAVLNEWRAAFRHGRAAVTTPEGRVGHSGRSDTRRGEAMWGCHTVNLLGHFFCKWL